MSPRAPKGCGTPGCRNLQPCKAHGRKPWGTPRVPLPGNWKSLCRAVRARDRGICRRCHRPTSPGEVDHIINRARGGTNDLKNLQLLCPKCHAVKSTWERMNGKRIK